MPRKNSSDDSARTSAPRRKPTKTRKSANAAENSPTVAKRTAIKEQPNSVAATVAGTNPPEHHIRERAYYIFAERGYTQGDPVQDWLQAERDLREQGR